MIELRVKRIKFKREEIFVKFADAFRRYEKAIFILLQNFKDWQDLFLSENIKWIPDK